MQEKLNERIRQIMLFLINRNNPVTLNEIADSLKVSSKTVRRDLVELDGLLTGYKAKICRRAGQGIWLEADADGLKQLSSTFLEKSRTVVYTPEERRTLIISRLLQHQEPVKLFEFTTLLKVSEATISKDLDRLEDWFARYQLELIRRPGLGIYVNGAEKDIRKAIVHYIYENINEKQLISMLHDALAENEPEGQSVAVSSSRRLLNLVNTEIIHKLEEAINKAAQSMNYRLSDRSLIGLVVHMALAVQRMQKNEKIAMDEQVLARLRECREFEISRHIAASIENIFAINVPESEIGYITMHVMGARNQLGSDGSTREVNKFKLVCLARRMIKSAQELLGCELIGNERLLIGLVNHLAPSISRIRLNMEIRNPLLKEMKAKYAELMEVSAAAAKPLEQELSIKLPEQEIAYLAMHFGAAVEEERLKRRRRYRIAVACPTGVGSSRLLASKVRHDFARLDVVGTVSALRLNAEELKRDKIDFVLATTPISNAPIEAVLVSSMLTEQDRAAIEAVISRLDEAADEPAAEDTGGLAERLRRLGRYNAASVAVLDSFFLEECETAQTVEAIIHFVSHLAAKDKAAEQQIIDSLRCREELSSTVISDQQIMLLHCETAGIDKPYFGIIRVAGGISCVNHAAGDNISIAAVMLLPSGGAAESAEVLGHITESIAERFSFSQSIHFDNGASCRQKLEKLIKDFYREKNKLILEES